MRQLPLVYISLIALVISQVIMMLYLPTQIENAIANKLNSEQLSTNERKERFEENVKIIIHDTLSNRTLSNAECANIGHEALLAQLSKLIEKSNKVYTEYDATPENDIAQDIQTRSTSLVFAQANDALEQSIAPGILNESDATALYAFFGQLTDEEEFYIYNKYVQAINDGTLVSETPLGLRLPDL